MTNDQNAIEMRGRDMEALIRTYFQACNDGDIATMKACFVPDGVHYFPPGMYEGPFRGADTIAQRWADAVATIGSRWTIDRMVVEASSYQAVLEWTHFKTKLGRVLRGDEWYIFDEESGLIREIRAYYASPQAPDEPRLELGGFDYAGRGYAVELPADLVLPEDRS
jgi:ketosteroid isomerase-like protein